MDDVKWAAAKMNHYFEAPCTYSFDDVGDVNDFIYTHSDDWCEDNCPDNSNNDMAFAPCWIKLFELLYEVEHDEQQQ